MIPIDVPKPSRYVKHAEVERIATECNRLYRQMRKHPKGYPVDVEMFAEFDLQTTIEWDEIEEPADTVVFAKCFYNKKAEVQYAIVLNNRYQELFVLRQDILRSCLSHEIGHIILCHHTWNDRPQNIDSLFPDLERQPQYLHDTSLKSYALTRKDIDDWCRKAMQGDVTARQKLKAFQDHLEPDWMFWQAEHFSMCFLIPRDRLYERLNEGWEVSNWPAIYRLAEHFGVSPSMMRVRLNKLGIIRMENGQIKLGQMLQQSGMFQ